jgi:Lon protease-like protein
MKVFPLPNAVLLPHSVIPLHIFEPRYQALVEDALATDSVMGLCALRPGWEARYTGRPPLEPLFCAGTIVWHEKLAGGRSNILLQGVCRARVRKEFEPKASYREVDAELLWDEPRPCPEEELLRRALLELGPRLSAGDAQLLCERAARVCGGPLADAVASVLFEEPGQRRQILCELDVPTRLRYVVAEVNGLLAQSVPGTSGLLN